MTPPGSCVDPVANHGGAENAQAAFPATLPAELGQHLIDSRLPHSLRDSHLRRGAACLQCDSWSLSADYVHEQGNHGYRAYSYTGGTNLFTPQLPLSRSITDAGRCSSPMSMSFTPTIDPATTDYWSIMQGNVRSPYEPRRPTTPFSEAHRPGAAFSASSSITSMVSAIRWTPSVRAITAPPAKMCASEQCLGRLSWHAKPAGIEVSGLVAGRKRASVHHHHRRQQRTHIDQWHSDGAGSVSRNPLHPNRPARQPPDRSLGDKWTATPFIEFFNLFNRNNPGANYVTNIATLPVPAAEAATGNV
jgi:hypothetical protein